jgi:hypothetical protein
MYLSEQHQHRIVDVQQLEQGKATQHIAEWSLRIGLLLGFLIVLTIEGWLLIKVLQH